MDVPASRLDEALKISAGEPSTELDDKGDLHKSTCPRCISNRLEAITLGLLPTALCYFLTALPLPIRRYRI